jgi:hypothetical protein
MNCGHYYIYIRKGEEEISDCLQESKWYVFNDSHVEVVNWDYVKKDSFGCKEENAFKHDGCCGYILKYIRVDLEKEILGEYNENGKELSKINLDINKIEIEESKKNDKNSSLAYCSSYTSLILQKYQYIIYFNFCFNCLSL